MEVANKFLTPSQCARELGITLDRVYVLLWGGQLAASKNERGEWQIPATPQDVRSSAAVGTSAAGGFVVSL